MIALSEIWPEGAQGIDVAVSSLALDSRQVQAGGLFFALLGSGSVERLEGFIASAIARGAAVVLTDTPVTATFAVPVRMVDDLRHQIGPIAARFLQLSQPVTPVRVAAVTGTNGKTTISRLLAELLAGCGQRSAVMGTTGNGILPQLERSTHTTLDALSLQQHLHGYAQQGARFACLEASSHGLEQGRLTGTPIEVAIFSNLTRDHLDYHGTLEAYAAAKAVLFGFPDVHTAVVNADDPASEMMLAHTPASLRVWRYSMTDPSADFALVHADYALSGAVLQIQTPTGPYTVHSPLLGRFNVSNLLAALAAGHALGLPMQDLVDQVPQLQGASGRMQVIADAERLLVVDYAHTPDALTQVLSSLRPHVAGQLWVVFGCGGDRDRGKRPLMTQAALAAADRLILTADNPRTEAVDAILADMQAGVSIDPARVMVEPDRRMAIRQALVHSQAGDAIVLAGKGHEDYQEIDGIRHWFDDVVELRQAAIGIPPMQTNDAMRPDLAVQAGNDLSAGGQSAPDQAASFLTQPLDQS